MIVIDVGCCPQGPEESVHHLIDRFHPDVLFGFDPFPELVSHVECIDGTVCLFSPRAAWTHDGHVAYSADGILSTAMPELMTKESKLVPCFDLATWLLALPIDPIVVKFDAEGAEFDILDRFHMLGVDALLALVLVEWHDEIDPSGERKDELTAKLRCPLELW